MHLCVGSTSELSTARLPILIPLYSNFRRGKGMKTAFVLFLSILLFHSQNSHSCTVFKSPFFADASISHNVDWYDAYPNVQGVLVMNPRGMKKVGELLGAPIAKAHWTSKWKSISFSITGAEFPVSGFNEQGLSMAILELPESKYPDAADPRHAVSTAQFVQYNLDQSSNIDEVIASDLVLRPYSSAFRMHFFVCDKTEECAVIQYLDGKMNVHRGSQLTYPVLTNSLYLDSVLAASMCKRGVCSQSDNSLWRFAKTSLMRSEMNPQDDYSKQAFSILDTVAQNKGTLTRFQITYDSKNQSLQIRKKGAALSHLSVDFMNVHCKSARKVIPITETSAERLENSWIDLTEQRQTEMALNIGLPAAAAAVYGKYPFSAIACE